MLILILILSFKILLITSYEYLLISVLVMLQFCQFVFEFHKLRPKCVLFGEDFLHNFSSNENSNTILKIHVQKHEMPNKLI